MYLNTYKHINTLADLFQDNIEDSISNLWDSYHTSINANESKDHYTFCCELPGYNKNEVSMSVKKGILSIAADNKERGKRFKKIMLPKDIDEALVSAKIKNGILEINVQKSKANQPKEIKVE
jgi:HSP20 family molecular chaperone IbpA